MAKGHKLILQKYVRGVQFWVHPYIYGCTDIRVPLLKRILHLSRFSNSSVQQSLSLYIMEA